MGSFLGKFYVLNIWLRKWNGIGESEILISVLIEMWKNENLYRIRNLNYPFFL